jgi:ferredoxin
MRRAAPNSEEIAELAAQYGAPGISMRISHYVIADEEVPSDDALPNGATGVPRFLSTGKCITCGACAEACALVGTGAITPVDNGVARHMQVDANMCIACKSCAEVCPAGNIEVTDDVQVGVRTMWGIPFELATCSVCGAYIGTEASLAYAIQKSSTDGTTDEREGQRAHLCDAHKRVRIAQDI